MGREKEQILPIETISCGFVTKQPTRWIIAIEGVVSVW
jgi:hypothetical protein